MPELSQRPYMVAQSYFSGRRRYTSWPRDWSSDVCSSDLANKLFLTIDWFVYNRLCSRRTHASDRWRQRVREPIHAQIPVFHRFFMRRQSSRSCAGGSPAGQIGGRIIDEWAPHG